MCTQYFSDIGYRTMTRSNIRERVHFVLGSIMEVEMASVTVGGRS